MRPFVLAVGALVIVSACGRVPGGPLTAGDYKLYEAASTGASQELSVIDSRSHSIELKMPMGTPSADWSHLYTVKSNVLVDLDPLTGTVLSQLQLPGYYQLPPATISGVSGGLSQSGRWLVLESFDQSSNSLPSASHFVVVDTSYQKSMRQIDLKGFFQFDAISNDGKRVFLIQYVSNTDYYVRFFDLGLGRLDPNVVFDKSDGSAAMGGTRLSGVSSKDGQWLYSVYVRQDRSAFIHALNLDGPVAFCLDLPGSGYSSNPDEFHWSLALSVDESHLYAANGAMGIVTDVSLSSGWPGRMRAARIDSSESGFLGVQNVEAKELGGNAAVVSPDGRTLVMAGKTGVVWVDAASLKAGDQQLAGWNVWSLAMSPDGSTLYAMSDAGKIAELPMAGSHAPTTFDGAGGQPLALIRVAAA